MTSVDAGGEGAPTTSGAMPNQEDNQEHQKEGQGPQARKSAEAPTQPAIGHDAHGPSAGVEQAGDQTQRGECKQHRKPPRDWAAIGAITNLVLAGIGIGGLFFTASQLIEMKNQLIENKRQANAAENANRIASDALASSDRAWLSVTTSIKHPLKENNQFQVIAQINNLGRTPAISTHYSFVMDVAKNYAALKTYEPLHTLASGTIFPNAAVTSPYGGGAPQITKDFIEDIESGVSQLFLRGNIEYRDIYHKKHTTKFCAYYLLGEKNFTPCEEENSNMAD